MKRLMLYTAALTLVLGQHMAFANGLGIKNGSNGGVASDPKLLTASPMVNPLKAPDTANIKADTAVSGDLSSGASLDSTKAFGSFGIPYTTTRVQHGPTAFGAATRNFLSTTYPYRASGRLTFTTPNGSAHCSATLVKRSVLITAAHCVSRFGSRSWYGNWVFTPGTYAPTGASATEIAPYGSYSWAYVYIATAWFNGTDTGSGAARNNDLAVIILNKNGSGFFAGQYTGWLAYSWNNYSFVSSPKTGNLLTAAVTSLGYPGLMDAGRIMQRADGPTFATTVGGALQYWQGSNFTGGSSGGPWIVNFSGVNPVLSGGAVQGAASVPTLVGVTSWGSADPNAPKDNYSSRFGQNAQFPAANYGGWGAGNVGFLMQGACNTVFTGGQTFAQLGYCS